MGSWLLVAASINSNGTMWRPGAKAGWPPGTQPKAEPWEVTLLLFGKWPLPALSSWHRRLNRLSTHLGSVFSSGQESDLFSIPIITIRAHDSITVWSLCLEIKLFILIISVSKASFFPVLGSHLHVISHIPKEKAVWQGAQSDNGSGYFYLLSFQRQKWQVAHLALVLLWHT